jgi:hypothetical protein
MSSFTAEQQAEIDRLITLRLQPDETLIRQLQGRSVPVTTPVSGWSYVAPWVATSGWPPLVCRSGQVVQVTGLLTAVTGLAAGMSMLSGLPPPLCSPGNVPIYLTGQGYINATFLYIVTSLYLYPSGVLVWQGGWSGAGVFSNPSGMTWATIVFSYLAA